MTSDTKQTEPVTELTAELRGLITGARFVLFDFDGPICRLFAGHKAEQVAEDQVRWLEARGLRELLTDEERAEPDPHAVLRAVDRRHQGSDLVIELEERLTSQELRAVKLAYPTPYVDPLIRTWHAMGARLAIATNNSPLVASRYLATRGLTDCFAPHIYGRTQDLSSETSPPLPESRSERSGCGAVRDVDDRRRGYGLSGGRACWSALLGLRA